MPSEGSSSGGPSGLGGGSGAVGAGEGSSSGSSSSSASGSGGGNGGGRGGPSGLGGGDGAAGAGAGAPRFPLQGGAALVAWADAGLPGAVAGGDTTGVRVNNLGRTPLAAPARKAFDSTEYVWPQSEAGFQNRGVECYMLAALQVLGPVVPFRRFVAHAQMSPLHPWYRFFDDIKKDFCRGFGGAVPSTAAAMCEHAGQDVLRRGDQDDAELALSVVLDSVSNGFSTPCTPATSWQQNNT